MQCYSSKYQKRKKDDISKAVSWLRGFCSALILIGFMLIIVEIKFTAPRIEDTPAKWREKIARSTEAPA